MHRLGPNVVRYGSTPPSLHYKKSTSSSPFEDDAPITVGGIAYVSKSRFQMKRGPCFESRISRKLRRHQRSVGELSASRADLSARS
jgi:hypothetical protein